MEHRWGKRAPVDVAVTLRLASGALERARIVNLSLSGALVRTEVPLPLYSRVLVKLAAKDSFAGSPQAVSALVVREALGGVGLEWPDFALPAIRALLIKSAETVQTGSEIEPAPACEVSPIRLTDRRAPAPLRPNQFGPPSP
jgi:hypothetical protein